MRRFVLFVVFCLAAFPLWADYGLSNVVIKQVDRNQQEKQPAVAPDETSAPQAAPDKNPVQVSPDKASSLSVPQYKKSTFYPYTIHISSWQNKKDALAQYKQKFQKLGGVFITKIDLEANGVWYRIDIGAFSTINEASARMKDLQANGIIDTEAFIGSSVPLTIEIGVYSDKSEALKVAEKLHGEGIVPYVMKEPGSVFRLLAGAFPSSKSAYPELEDITALGLESKITKR